MSHPNYGGYPAPGQQHYYYQPYYPPPPENYYVPYPPQQQYVTYGGQSYWGPPVNYYPAQPTYPRRYGATFGQIDPATGHDYRRLDDGGTPVDEARVHAILAERLRYKLNRNYDQADRLRDELTELGVLVHDREKTWEVRRSSVRDKRLRDDVPFTDLKEHHHRDDDDDDSPTSPVDDHSTLDDHGGDDNSRSDVVPLVREELPGNAAAIDAVVSETNNVPSGDD